MNIFIYPNFPKDFKYFRGKLFENNNYKAQYDNNSNIVDNIIIPTKY